MDLKENLQKLSDQLKSLENQHKILEVKINSVEGIIKLLEIKAISMDRNMLVLQEENENLKRKKIELQDEMIPVVVPQCRTELINIWEAIVVGSLLSVNFFYKDNPSSINEEFGTDITLEHGSKAATSKSTPMHLAAYLGHAHIVEFLINKGADIDKKDSKSFTPLLRAIEHDHLDVVVMLAELGASKEFSLVVACELSYMHIIRYLLDNGVNIDEKDNVGETVLMKSIEQENFPVFKMLCEKGANKTNALHLAAGNGNLRIIKYLLSEEGMELDEKDRDGNTPLMKAIENKQMDCINLLIKKGADKNIKNNNHKTALHLAKYLEETDLKNNTEFSSYTAIVKYLS